MHKTSDEEIDEERDEEIDEKCWDEIHVTMDKQIESSDDEKDESDLSGIEALDDEADVLITEIEEYITSEEEMNEIAFANNDTEESRRDVEVDESIDFNVTFIERFVHFCLKSHEPMSLFLWQAWLGIVDQNWLKLALAKLALGQSIFLKVVGMPTPVKTTVRSKFPFICM